MESSKLAAYVASRVCHDVASPLQSLMQACELLEMGDGMRAEGEKSLREAVAKLEAKLKFLRFAVGSQAINDGYASVHEARGLFQSLFAVANKTELDWQVSTNRITNRQMRLLMNMTLIMLDPATRGVCRVTAREDGKTLTLDVEAISQFAKLKPEVSDVLAGREPTDGWSGSAIQPYLSQLLADEIGFKLSARAAPGAVALTAVGAVSEG